MRLGSAIHRWGDGSKTVVDVHVTNKNQPGFPAEIRWRRFGTKHDYIPICGASQARRLGELLNRAADRLEKRGDL